MIHSLANKRGSQSAVASLTLAHCGVFDSFGLGNWDSITSPAESAVCNPAALAVCRCNPNLHAAAFEFDLQSPFGFEVDAFRKHCLLNGLDDIGLTMQKQDLIKAYEEKHRQTQPWLFVG